ncbi:MAG: carbon-nitrogen hydrolase family protein [Bacteriovorax sp.]|jgi:predicted amidohydrolase|nr:carbon-nitrogen hydrolase family protein [Bacteriovorax sp.]
MRIAVIQLTSLLDYKINLQKIRQQLIEAKALGASVAFLPEVFYSMSDGITPTPHLVEEGNKHYDEIKKLAQDFEIALIGGSAATLKEGKVVNRAYNFDKQGIDLGHYDKINLFACDLPNKKISEAKNYTAGTDYKMVEIEAKKIGLGICFDMRFSELGLHYRLNGAEILTYPAAFTVPTGKAHWHILLRARAIENQCFVVAAAQWGHHNDKMQTYGHSLVVDPWGDILLDLGEGEKVGVVDLDFSRVDLIRHSVLMSR